jgi:hypothetical protein
VTLLQLKTHCHRTAAATQAGFAVTSFPDLVRDQTALPIRVVDFETPGGDLNRCLGV